VPLKNITPEDVKRLIKELPKELHDHLSVASALEYVTARFHAQNINPSGDGGVYDTLTALVMRGPLDAGDVPSKAGRHDLVEHGLAVVDESGSKTSITWLGRQVFIHLWCPDNPRVSLGVAVANYHRKQAARQADTVPVTA
jgi:hypothetical protein